MALRTLRVFISSPGDVTEERVIARRVIGRLDAQFGDFVHLEAIYWEATPLAATASFQEQLGRPSEADVAVVILWSRLGTALPATLVRADGSTYASGTEYEFEDAVESFRRIGRPRLVAYRKTAAVPVPADLDAREESLHQQQAMERFVGRWFRNEADGTFKGAFHNFASPAEFEELLEAHLTRIAEASLPDGVVVRGAAPTWRDASPFRGLEVFEPEHAPVFFGRTGAVAQVLAKLRAQGQAGKRFVLVVSMSGAGKSSLVRAGVLPLLTQPGVVGDASTWVRAVMRPSDGLGHPLAALVRAIDDATAMEAGPRDPPDDASAAVVTRWVVDRLDERACDLALVVDQLEEAFSDERIDDAARTRFFEAIDALARTGRVWIVATMRSDAYPRIAEQPLLVDLKEGDGQFDLLPPTLREIGQIIRFPAAAAGLRFETRPSTAEKLDDVIRDAGGRNPGALPLLQFLLEELYRRRSREDVLTFRAYEELGGVEGALAQRAEAVLATVSEAAQATLPHVLRELVTFDDDESKALRRVAPRDAFQSNEANELVDALLDARLLVASLDADGTATVALAHEALLEFWPRLKEWRDTDRELLLVHARLVAATRAWERNDRSADLLLARGKPLAEAKLLTAAGVRLAPAESALVHASDRRARRFGQLRIGAIAGLAVLAVVAGAAAWRATIESKRAQVQATTAQRTTDFMVSLFANADPDQNQGEKVTVREVLDRGVEQIATELEGEDGVQSNLLRAMGQSYNALGLFPKASSVLRDALAHADQSGVPTNRIDARLALAENRYRAGDNREAEALYRTILDETSTDRALVRRRAQALTGLGELLVELNRYDEADAAYNEAEPIARAEYGPDDAEVARILDDRGKLAYSRHQYDVGIALMQQALTIRKARFGPHDSRVAATLGNLGSSYYQLGRIDEAMKAFGEALPIYEAVFGPEHRRYAGQLNNVARLELLAGRLDPAERDFNRVLAIYRKTLPEGHIALILPLNSLAMIHLSRNEAMAAAPLLEESKAIAAAQHHWMLDQVLTNEAELALAQGHVDDAVASLRQARDAAARQYGDKLSTSEAWRTAVMDVTEARVMLERRDRAAAGRLIDGALPTLEKRFGRDGFYVREARTRQAAARS